MEQNNSNHSQFVTGYHRVLALLLFAGLIGSIVNMVESLHTDNLYSASLLVLLFIICFLTAWFARSFPLKAQDRAIRAEENFRHYILTGKQLSPNLKIGQIVALRFASDEEYPALTEKCLQENMTPKQIKAGIKNWKPDFYRV
jgi:hypothetical protein